MNQYCAVSGVGPELGRVTGWAWHPSLTHLHRNMVVMRNCFGLGMVWLQTVFLPTAFIELGEHSRARRTFRQTEAQGSCLLVIGLALENGLLCEVQ